jgi:hypothetical protein
MEEPTKWDRCHRAQPIQEHVRKTLFVAAEDAQSITNGGKIRRQKESEWKHSNRQIGNCPTMHGLFESDSVLRSTMNP